MYEELFLRRLNLLRNEKDVSARDMSLSIGQNASYINSVENGLYLPSMTVFFYICEYFGVSPSEFFNERDRYPIQVQEVLDIMLTMDKEQLDAISAMVKALKK